MNKRDRLKNFFTNKRNESKIRAELKDVKSKYSEIVWTNEVMFKASMGTIAVSSIVLLVIILKSILGTITVTELLIFCSLLFSANLLVMGIMWAAFKAELNK